MALKINSHQATFEKYLTYRAMLRDASGIYEKSPVRVAGIDAGYVTRIQLSGERALVTFDVLGKVVVTEGSQLEIKTVGFLGEKYLEIMINQESQQRLAAESIIPALESGGMSQLTDNVGKALENMLDIVTVVKQAIAPEKPGGVSPLQSIIYSMQEFTENLAYELDANNRDSLMAGIHKVSAVLEISSISRMMSR